MADSDRPEQDELNKINDKYLFVRPNTLRGKAKLEYEKWLDTPYDEWQDFMLGCDPAWHEYKGPIKQDD
jgi:hypothetical protein